MRHIKFFFIVLVCMMSCILVTDADAVRIESVNPKEDVVQYVKRIRGVFDQKFYQQVIGAANAFKEGDQALGIAADDISSRENARILLSNTKVRIFHNYPVFKDNLQELIWRTTDISQYEKIKDMTLGELKIFLLTKSEIDIKDIMSGLNSAVIGCVVKLMNNNDLTMVGKKIFNPLPGVT